jgi:iron(III) transport system substrate-binding protein
MRPLSPFATLLLAASFAVPGCSPASDPARVTNSLPANSGKVVVYTSVDDVCSRPICEQFEKETGIQVVFVPDTEETKGTGLVNRLLAEKGRPQADVFWSGDPVRAAILKAKGVTAPYRSPAADGLPPEFSDPDGHWTGFSARARLIIYNTNLVPQDQKPRSVRDLADPTWKSQTCLANPLFGTMSMHAAALFEVMGDDAAKRLFQSLADNDVKILSSNGEVRRRVANGDYAFGLTDTDDARVAMLDGKPVDAVYPDADGLGTLVVPNAVALIAGAPHAEAGKKFIDYLLRPETELALANSEAAQMPLRPAVQPPEGVTPISTLTPMRVDYAKLADRLDELAGGFLKEWVDRNL